MRYWKQSKSHNCAAKRTFPLLIATRACGCQVSCIVIFVRERVVFNKHYNVTRKFSKQSNKFNLNTEKLTLLIKINHPLKDPLGLGGSDPYSFWQFTCWGQSLDARVVQKKLEIFLEFLQDATDSSHEKTCAKAAVNRRCWQIAQNYAWT